MHVVPQDAYQPWKARLTEGPELNESDAMQMLRDFGINASSCCVVSDKTGLRSAAAKMTWPLVLKTAAGVAHKSDHDGVRLNIQSEDELFAAFEDLQRRLGRDRKSVV